MADIDDSSPDCSEIRLPVAYSHGGFAQMRHVAAPENTNLLGPIEVPEFSLEQRREIFAPRVPTTEGVFAETEG